MRLSRLAAGCAVLGSLAQSRPNIILILTDDQDLLLDSLSYMQGLKANLQDYGTTYSRHYCTSALCCPARASLLTGKAVHNTNVTDILLPFGGYGAFSRNGFQDKWFGPWLQAAGYNTYYTGKFLNGMSSKNYNNPPINGLDGHDFLLAPGVYNYSYPLYQRNEDLPMQYNNEYTTDLLMQKSLGFLDDAVEAGVPFFLGIAPVAIHAQLNDEADDPSVNPADIPPQPAPKYADLFSDAKIPRTANFNPKTRSGSGWVKDVLLLNQTQIDLMDEWYRQRLRALQSVDELINKTVDALQSYGILDNTYIIFTSDNGYHMGSHRLGPGKRTPYEEDVHVPMVIRGPGIPAGRTANFITSHLDIAPTMLKWANATQYAPAGFLDGLPIPLVGDASGQNWEQLQIEMWGPMNGFYLNLPYSVTKNNTYKALRLFSSGYDLYYSVWCNKDHEMYDMIKDPYQMANLHNKKLKRILGVPAKTIESRLDALLLVTKTCVESTCTDPWTALHPQGDVTNLMDALDPKYDAFYAAQNKVTYKACRPGYFPSVEKPLNYNQYEPS